MPQPIRSRLARPLMPTLAAAVLLLGAVAARADEWCTLSLKDGRSVAGTLIDQNDEQVTVRPEGSAPITYSRSEIAGLRLEKSPRETYLEKRDTLKADDLDGRYNLLIQFYYKNEKSQTLAQVAKAEADQLAQDFPDSKQVKTLVRVIANRLAKKDEPADGGPAGGEPKTGGPKPAGPEAKPEPKAGGRKDEEQLPAAPVVGILSSADQNLLRVYELDFTISRSRVTGADRSASVALPKELVEILFKTHADSDELAQFKGPGGAAKFRQMPPLAQLNTLFAIRDRTLYPKVEVRTEPAVLAAFRSNIHSHVVTHFSKYFAGQVHGLIAKPKSVSGQAEAYTNFQALNLGVVDGHPVIDRDTPEDSLLLQWSLPRTVAKYPAPNIKGWRPAFQDAKDTRFVEIAKWIKTTFPADGVQLPQVGGAAPGGQSGGSEAPLVPGASRGGNAPHPPVPGTVPVAP